MGKTHSKGLLYFVRIALFTALTVLLSWISIPFTPPLTLQLLAISMNLYLLGGTGGFLSTLLYLAMGAIGLAVFSGFVGGIGHLFSATGGFLFGFLVYCLIYGVLCRAFGDFGRRRLMYSSIGLVALYALGSLWYTFVYLGGENGSYFASFAITVLPFIIPDVIKIAVAYIVSSRLDGVITKGKK